ncbi:hypothetical protein [uncultured Brevundimonas sp.]|uniref:hypothetical protein n=1 Tax=uncultured Brevundimonas sp. TaxID=213418 RepID=UPI0030EBBCBE|tara:strand:+ start:1882 stop:2310 length:429 start_codon:yes stop_codon:yes gene_type:complete
MAVVTVRHLAASDIDEAFVLVRLGYAELSQDDWRVMARQRIEADEATGGILIAHDRADRLRGLLLYAIAPKFAGRPSLQIDRLISFDLLDPAIVADALIAEVLRVAEIQDCDSLSLVRPLDAPLHTTALVLASGATVLHQVF